MPTINYITTKALGDYSLNELVNICKNSCCYTCKLATICNVIDISTLKQYCREELLEVITATIYEDNSAGDFLTDYNIELDSAVGKKYIEKK